MKMTKVLALVMAALMLLTACGGDGGNKQQNVSSGEGPWGAYEEPLLVTGVLEYSALTDDRVPSTTTPSNQKFIQLLKKYYNIDFQFLWTAPANMYEQKLSVAILSEELPDIMKVSASDFEMLRENGQLAELSGILDYASENVKGYLERCPEIMEEMIQEHGGLYAIPAVADPYKTMPIMYIREDWLQKAGLQVPASAEELESVAEAFVNQCGAAYGFAMCNNVSAPQFCIGWYMNTLGSAPYFWLKQEDGTVAPGEIQPEAKDALIWLNKLYTKGLIDPDFATKSVDLVTQDIVNGKVGIVYGPWWQYEWPLATAMNNNRDVKWICAPVPGYAQMARQNITEYYVVNVNFKNPEVLMKIFNLYDKVTGTDEAKPEDGYVWSWAPAKLLDPYDVRVEHEVINKQLEVDPTAQSEAPESWPAQAKRIWKAYPMYLEYLENPATSKYDNDMFGNIFTRVNKDGAWSTLTKAAESGNILYNEYCGINTPAMRKRGASLSKLVNETYLKIITGMEPADSFDKFVEDWNAMGGAEVTKEVNQWYQEHGTQP